MERPPIPTAILASHAGFVRALAGALLRDGHQAEDVAQDAMLAALRHPPGHGDSLRGWFATVTRRLAARARRSDRRRRQRVEDLARQGAGGPGPMPEGPESILAEVTEAVLALPAPYREAVWLRFYENLSPGEIADRIGAPLQTVHSRIRRALARLRVRLDQRVEGGRSGWQAGLVVLTTGGGGIPPPPLSALAISTAAMTNHSKLVLCLLVLALGALWIAFADPFREVPPDQVGIADHGLDRRDLTAGEDTAGSGRGPERAMVEPHGTPVVDSDPPATERATLLIRAFHHDRTLAVGRSLKIWSWQDPEPFAGGTRRRTDAQGQILFRNLVPGKINLYGDLSHSATVVTEAGKTTVFDFVFAEGYTLRGTVVDPTGRGVAGAQIWLSDYGNPNSGTPLAIADSGGRFLLRGVGESRTVSAFAPGYGPSRQQHLEVATGGSIEVELRLTAAHARLAGVLIGVDGQASEGAEIRVEQPRRRMERQPDGSTSGGLSHRDAVSDREGRFAVAGLAAGATVLEVRCPGCAVHREELVLVEGESRTVEVRLVAAPVVSGVVRDGEGRPVARAEIRHGTYGGFLSTFVRSDSLGRFRLDHLPVGAVELQVEKSGVGERTETLELSPGLPRTWQPVLRAEHGYLGRIVDEAGEPRVGWSVYAVSNQRRPAGVALWSQFQRTDATGRFRFAGCPDATLRLEVRSPESTAVAVRSLLRQAIDQPEHLLVIRGEDLPSASLRGEVLDPRGNPARGVLYASVRGASGPYRAHPDARGRFRIDSVLAGDCTLSFVPETGPTVRLAEVTLQRGEDRDLGRQQLEEPGSLQLSVGGLPGVRPPFAGVTVTPDHSHPDCNPRSPRFPTVLRKGQGAEFVLLPGRYLVWVSAKGFAEERRRIAIRSGGATAVDLIPRPGAACTIRCRYSGSIPDGVQLEIFDAGGDLVGTRLARSSDGVLTAPRFYLVAGKYRLVARETIPAGAAKPPALRSGELRFQVAQGLEGATRVVELRLP